MHCPFTVYVEHHVSGCIQVLIRFESFRSPLANFLKEIVFSEDNSPSEELLAESEDQDT